MLLPLDDREDFEDARRGFVAAPSPALVSGTAGRVVWDMESYAFLASECPATVNPSLWRQSQLNAIHGLFEVVPGDLPGARPRPLQHDDRRGSRGRAGDRPADLRGDRGGGAGAVSRPSRRATGERACCTPTATSTTSAGHWAWLTRGRRRGARARAGAGGLPGARDHRERATPAPRWRVARRTCSARRCQRGPRGHVGTGLGMTVSTGSHRDHAPHARDREHRPGGDDRRDRDDLPDDPRQRGAGGDELPLPRPSRAVYRRERHPQPPQRHHPARRARARRAHLVALPRRGDRALRRAHRRAVRRAPMAALGAGADRRDAGSAARPVRLPARPDGAPAQQGVRRQRDRRAADVAGRSCAGVALPRVLRNGQPQREGDLPALHGLVRRQPRPPLVTPPRAGRHALRAGHGRHEGGAARKAAARSRRETTAGWRS